METKSRSQLDPKIKQVRYGQTLVLWRDHKKAVPILKDKAYTLARIWYMTYRLNLHNDLRNSWLDYFLPYINQGTIRFKRRSNLIGARRLAMALDAIYYSEPHSAFAIIESVDFIVRVSWHHWLTQKLKSNTWQYDVRIRTYKKMIILLNHFNADSTDKNVLRKIAHSNRPDDPDKYHNLLFEENYGDGRLLEWAKDGFWSIPLHDHSPEVAIQHKKQLRKRKSLVRRLISFFM